MSSKASADGYAKVLSKNDCEKLKGPSKKKDVEQLEHLASNILAWLYFYTFCCMFVWNLSCIMCFMLGSLPRQLLLDGWQLMQKSPAKENVKVMAFGKMCCRGVLHVLGKEKQGREPDGFQSLQEIGILFSDALNKQVTRDASGPAQVQEIKIENLVGASPSKVALLQNEHLDKGKLHLGCDLKVLKPSLNSFGLLQKVNKHVGLMFFVNCSTTFWVPGTSTRKHMATNPSCWWKLKMMAFHLNTALFLGQVRKWKFHWKNWRAGRSTKDTTLKNVMQPGLRHWWCTALLHWQESCARPQCKQFCCKPAKTMHQPRVLWFSPMDPVVSGVARTWKKVSSSCFPVALWAGSKTTRQKAKWSPPLLAKAMPFLVWRLLQTLEKTRECWIHIIGPKAFQLLRMQIWLLDRWPVTRSCFPSSPTPKLSSLESNWWLQRSKMMKQQTKLPLHQQQRRPRRLDPGCIAANLLSTAKSKKSFALFL